MKKKPVPKKIIRNLDIKTKFLSNQPKKINDFRSKKQYQEQQNLLLALQQISKVLTAEVDLQKILADMATIVAKSLGSKWVNFWQLTPDKKNFYIVAHYGMKPEYMKHSRQYPIPLGRAWIGRAIKTGKAWGTSDILKDPVTKELGPRWEEVIKKQDYRGLLCVPLTSGRKKVGGMCAYFTNPHDFTDFEMRLMTVAANQAATAVTNSEIFTELLYEKNKIIAILNSLSDGIIMYDLDNKITVFNPKSEEILWVRKKEIFNKKITMLSPENPLLKNIIDISSLVIEDFETKELLIKKPQRSFLKITQVPVRNAQDQKFGTMRVLHDITAEKESEELKSRFVSVASHQLRTPLSRIKWGLDMFLKKELGELNLKQIEFLKKINNDNDLMVGLIRDLLDISRIEEGRFGYKFELINIEELLEKIILDFNQDAKKEKLKIIFKKTGDFPKISADVENLTMAIQNIIDNTIKYTASGGKIFISLYKGKETLIINIKDTGIGIPRDQIKFIFQKFFRAKNAIRFKTEGSGLGLWIANEIIKRHNGKISFESEESKGSTFFLQFPINPSLMPKGKIEIY